MPFFIGNIVVIFSASRIYGDSKVNFLPMMFIAENNTYKCDIFLTNMPCCYKIHTKNLHNLQKKITHFSVAINTGFPPILFGQKAVSAFRMYAWVVATQEYSLVVETF